MAIVGQRLCATLGSHHHHHYISSVSVQRIETTGALQYQRNYKKIPIMMSSLHRIWKDKRLSSTPNRITSKYWSYQSFSRWPRPAVWTLAGHQRKSLKCLWQILHIRWHLDVTNAYFVTHSVSSMGAVGRKAGPDGVPGHPHFPLTRYALLTFQMLQFNFIPGVRSFVPGLYTSCFLLSPNT